jgi:hypothetical protein
LEFTTASKCHILLLEVTPKSVKATAAVGTMAGNTCSFSQNSTVTTPPELPYKLRPPATRPSCNLLSPTIGSDASFVNKRDGKQASPISRISITCSNAVEAEPRVTTDKGNNSSATTTCIEETASRANKACDAIMDNDKVSEFHSMNNNDMFEEPAAPQPTANRVALPLPAEVGTATLSSGATSESALKTEALLKSTPVCTSTTNASNLLLEQCPAGHPGTPTTMTTAASDNASQTIVKPNRCEFGRGNKGASVNVATAGMATYTSSEIRDCKTVTPESSTHVDDVPKSNTAPSGKSICSIETSRGKDDALIDTVALEIGEEEADTESEEDAAGETTSALMLATAEAAPVGADGDITSAGVDAGNKLAAGGCDNEPVRVGDSGAGDEG